MHWFYATKYSPRARIWFKYCSRHWKHICCELTDVYIFRVLFRRPLLCWRFISSDPFWFMLTTTNSMRRCTFRTSTWLAQFWCNVYWFSRFLMSWYIVISLIVPQQLSSIYQTPFHWDYRQLHTPLAMSLTDALDQTWPVSAKHSKEGNNILTS